MQIPNPRRNKPGTQPGPGSPVPPHRDVNPDTSSFRTGGRFGSVAGSGAPPTRGRNNNNNRPRNIGGNNNNNKPPGNKPNNKSNNNGSNPNNNNNKPKSGRGKPKGNSNSGRNGESNIRGSDSNRLISDNTNNGSSSNNNNNGNGSGNNSNNNRPSGGNNMPRGNNNNNGGNGRSNYNSWNDQSPSKSSGSSSWYSVNNGSSGNVSFDSGVKTGIVYNRAQDRNGSWCPLYVQCGELFPPYLITDDADNYLNRIIFKDVYIEMLRLVRLSTTRNISSEFSLNNWYNYTYNVAKLLQLYYMYDSIQAYMTEPSNQNLAMHAIYADISPDAWQAFSEAKLCLSKQFIHPNFHDLIFKLYQNYTPTEYDSGAIYKLSWNEMLNGGITDYTRFYDGTEIRSTIDAIQTNTMLEINALMNKAFPSWRINECKPSYINLQYDEDFLTFWTNCSVSSYSATNTRTEYTKSVGEFSANLPYYLYKNDVDGVLYSLNTFNLFIDPGYQVYGGMWAPQIDYSKITNDDDKASLLMYFGDAAKMRPLSSINYSAHSGLARGLTWDSLGQKFEIAVECPPNTKPALYSSINSIEQTCNDGFRYLLYPNTAP